MNAKKKGITPGNVISWLLGLACALVLGAVFYGAMAYQLTGDEADASVRAGAVQTPPPLAPGLTSAALYPGALLALSGAQLTQEQAQDVMAGGRNCRVITRVYALSGGREAKVISAYPGAYLEHLANEGYTAQLITGFSLAGMDAVYALDGGRALLAAQEGECVYLLEADADEQTVYALGAAAYLE